MPITKKEILGKTHYGLGIYAYILRLFYPGEVVLRISGRECDPTKNPYNNNRPSLKISVVDYVARHLDYEKAIPDGDAFDFAARYYNLEGDALLRKINEDLHLKLDKEGPLFYEKSSKPFPAPTFSYFSKPIRNINPAKTISLVEVYEIIRSTRFSGHVSQLRLLADKHTIREYKARNLDYVTFSGIFTQRKDEDRTQASNLLVVDIDDLPFQEISGIKQKLLSDKYFETELLFTSPSGKGLKWVIPFDAERTNHAFFFNAIFHYLKSTYKIRVDRSGRDISRACYLTHDPNCYINPKYI